MSENLAKPSITLVEGSFRKLAVAETFYQYGTFNILQGHNDTQLKTNLEEIQISSHTEPPSKSDMSENLAKPSITLVEGSFRKLAVDETFYQYGTCNILQGHNDTQLKTKMEEIQISSHTESPNKSDMSDNLAKPSITLVEGSFHAMDETFYQYETCKKMEEIQISSHTEPPDIKICKAYSENILSKEDMQVSSGVRKFSTGSVKFDTDFNMNAVSKGMLKLHYVNTGERSNCSNKHCQKKFSVKRRPRHCRRCGELFCINCLGYRRKLNKVARPDPSGTARKVCKWCFEEDVFTAGCSRQLTGYFMSERTMAHSSRVLHQRAASLTTTFWRDQLDILKECDRLLDGFMEAVGHSETKRTLHELKHIVKPPQWQQSSHWKVEMTSGCCRVCKGGLGLRMKCYCKVCGLALCKRCSNRDLLLYIPGKEAPDGENARAILCVINVPGSPIREPNVSLLLHVCSECKTYISTRQTSDAYWFFGDRINRPMVDDLETMDGAFTRLQTQINNTIVQCEEIVNNCEKRESETNDLAEAVVSLGDRAQVSTCNVQVSTFNDIATPMSVLLFKLETDLGLFETQYKRLPQLSSAMTSKTQRVFFLNYSKSKYDFIMERKHRYRHIQKYKPANCVHQHPSLNHKVRNNVDLIDRDGTSLVDVHANPGIATHRHAQTKNITEKLKTSIRSKLPYKSKRASSKARTKETEATLDCINSAVSLGLEPVPAVCAMGIDGNPTVDDDVTTSGNDDVFLVTIDTGNLSCDDNLEINTTSVQWSKRSNSR